MGRSGKRVKCISRNKMRFYKIINKSSGLLLSGVFWKPAEGKGKNRIPEGYKLTWITNVDGQGPFRRIDNVNTIIGNIIYHKLQAELDNCEIQTFEQKYVPIKGPVKLTRTVNRLEQERLAEVLKGYM